MSLRILAFDTSTEVCSVALMVDNIVNSCCGVDLNQHEKQILSIIDNLLLEANITLQSLDFVAFCRGPGSFVGVRIGVSIAQGLALGANLPLVAISSLEILAQGIWRLIAAKQVLATINARLGELYLACYCHQDDNVWSKWCNEILIRPKDMFTLISRLNGRWVLIGTGWERYPILLSDDLYQISVRKILYPSAQDMLPIAIQNWKRGDLLTVNEIQPVYLHKMDYDNKFHKLNNKTIIT